MRLRTALSMAKQIRFVRSVLRRYSDSLAKGTYRLFDTFLAAALDDPETCVQATRYFYKPGATVHKARVAAVLNKLAFFKNTNKNTTAEYDAFYMANNHDAVREIKLFSFKRQKMLTICTGPEELETQLQRYHRFGGCFDMPSVTKRDRYPYSCEIAMVELLDSRKERDALEAIVRATMKVQTSDLNTGGTKRVCDLVMMTYADETINAWLQAIVSQIDSMLLETAIPTCIQHGDLSKDNLLYGVSDGKTAYWYIDWEHAGERLFFYDWFFYMVNAAMYYDDRALRLYVNGEADAVASVFFESFGLTFRSDHRKDWFLLFMLVFLKERVCDLGNVAALKKYAALIEMYFG